MISQNISSNPRPASRGAFFVSSDADFELCDNVTGDSCIFSERYFLAFSSCIFSLARALRSSENGADIR